MTSPLVPQATVKLSGQEYKLRLDLNALTDFEQMTGKSVMRGGLQDISNLEMTDVRALLWACLVQEDESLSIREVGRLIGIEDISTLAEVITNMIAAAMPDAAAQAEAQAEGEADTDPLTTPGSPTQSGGPDSGPPPSSTSE